MDQGHEPLATRLRASTFFSLGFVRTAILLQQANRLQRFFLIVLQHLPLAIFFLQFRLLNRWHYAVALLHLVTAYVTSRVTGNRSVTGAVSEAEYDAFFFSRISSLFSTDSNLSRISVRLEMATSNFLLNDEKSDASDLLLAFYLRFYAMCAPYWRQF